MIKPTWTQFNWDLTSLSDNPPEHQVRADLRLAEKEDVEKVWVTLESCFYTDQGWSVGLRDKLKDMRELVEEGIEDKRMSCYILEDGPRIIGVSGMIEKEDFARTLATGVCVLQEYRCRGVGTLLLYHTLKYLKGKGLKSASVVTRSNVAAAKFLYPKFGSVSEQLKLLPAWRELEVKSR